RTFKSLVVIGFVVLMNSQNGYAQFLPECQTNPLLFGLVVPGESKSVQYDDVSNALCHRILLRSTVLPISAYFTLPTHLTNGIDVSPIASVGTHAFLIRGERPDIVRPTFFNPINAYNYTHASRFIQFNVGATITVPPLISPGSYTATVTINVIHQ